jgi:arylsulfatase A-like enzyme
MNRRSFVESGVAAGMAPLMNAASAQRPNVLVLMTDQMQGRTLDPHHSHGVTHVTSVTFPDEAMLRTSKPHWAQRFADAGYRTGYFGKWHVERSNEVRPFGWHTACVQNTKQYEEVQAEVLSRRVPEKPLIDGMIPGLPGYKDFRLYGAGIQRPKDTLPTVTTVAKDFLRSAVKSPQPWVCFASVVEPHDPYLTSRDAFSRYKVDEIPEPPNWNDRLDGRPGMYRKAARTFASMTTRQKREAAACYYGMITEIDQAFGELLRMVEESGQADNTIIVLTTDHGECLGAHGLYMKSITGCEETYNIPLVVSGPGIARGALSNARVGSIDIGPTLLELAGLPPLGAPDSQSFAAALRDPAANSAKFQVGYAENNGGRFIFTQRVVWDGPWKLVWNGFDFDELYNLDQDPYELRNLAQDPGFEPQFRRMMQTAWRKVRDTNDTPLLRSTYPLLRLAPYGPDILNG